MYYIKRNGCSDFPNIPVTARKAHHLWKFSFCSKNFLWKPCSIYVSQWAWLKLCFLHKQKQIKTVNRKHTYLFYGNVNCTSKAKPSDKLRSTQIDNKQKNSTNLLQRAPLFSYYQHYFQPLNPPTCPSFVPSVGYKSENLPWPIFKTNACCSNFYNSSNYWKPTLPTLKVDAGFQTHSLFN